MGKIFETKAIGISIFRCLVKSHIDYFDSVSSFGLDFFQITKMSAAVAPMSPSHFGPGIQKDPENNQKVSDVNLLGVAAIIKSMWVFLPKVSRFSVYLILF